MTFFSRDLLKFKIRKLCMYEENKVIDKIELENKTISPLLRPFINSKLKLKYSTLQT